MSQINIKQLLAGDAQQENIDKLNFNFGQISEFGGGPPGIQGEPGVIGLAGGRGPIGKTGLVGPRGSQWKVIEADPNILNVPNPLLDDLAYNRYTGHLFSFVSGAWVDQGKLVQDGTFFERDGTVFYNLPLHEGVVKSIVLAPVDYRTLNIDPLVGNFRPTLKMLSNNLSNPFLTFGFIDSVGFEVPRTKQIGMYLEDNANGFDYILSNASGSIISSAGPNHLKIGTDNTYRFTSSGQSERLLFDLSDVSKKYILFGGDNDGFTKLLFGSDKLSPALVINDLGFVGVNVLDPQTQLHTNGNPLTRDKNSFSTPLILGSDVGGGNSSKIHFEVNRLARVVDGFETDSAFTSLRRVDAGKFSGFVGFTGGLTNTKPTVQIGFSTGPNVFDAGHNDKAIVIVDSNGANVTGNLSASGSLTVGDRSGVVGKLSMALGEGTEASKEGSVAIGSGSISNHKNGIVLGSGNSVQEDSVLVANSFSIKKGNGSFDPSVVNTPDYFDSRNPLANAPFFLLYKDVAASLQHDDTVNGMEIVNFGPTGYVNGPVFGGQPRPRSGGMSLMITGAELDGKHPYNIFSIGNDRVTIGAAPIADDVDNLVIGNYFKSRYALSVNGPILFNSYSANQENTIGSSHIVAPYSLFSTTTERAATIIRGGGITSAEGNTAIGGSIVLIPGIGITPNTTGSKSGYVALSPEDGNVYIGKRYAEGLDKLQVLGSSYFHKPSRTGPTVVIGIVPAALQAENVTGLAGYIQTQSAFIDRNTIESVYAVSGKIAYSWNSETSAGGEFGEVRVVDPGAAHITSNAGVYAVIGTNGNSVNNYAAYFEDTNTTLDERPTVKIKSPNLGLSVEGKIKVSDTVTASEFIPTDGWVNVPFNTLTINAFNGLTACTPTFSEAGGALLLSNTGSTRIGTSSARSTPQRFQSFRMGPLVMFNFNMVIELITVTATPQSIEIGGLPMYVNSYTLGTVYVWGYNSAGVELGELCPLVAGNPGVLQIQLPQVKEWESVRKMSIAGSITCNAALR